MGQHLINYGIQMLTTFWTILKIAEGHFVEFYKGSFIEQNIDAIIWFNAVWIILYIVIELASEYSDKDKNRFKIIENELSQLNNHYIDIHGTTDVLKVNVQQLYWDFEKMKKKMVRLEKEMKKYD